MGSGPLQELNMTEPDGYVVIEVKIPQVVGCGVTLGAIKKEKHCHF
jgi:hypothetical protein